MQNKKNNSGHIFGIASLIYFIFMTGAMIKPIGRYLNPILDKFYEIQPFKEGWFILILVFLYCWAVVISFVYLKILYDDFNLKDKLFSNNKTIDNQNRNNIGEQVWKNNKQIIECYNSSCKGQIRLTKYKEGFVKCPHCNERIYVRT